MPLSTTKLGALTPGLNNRLPATQLGFSLPDRTRASFLSVAENVDIARGVLRRREGFTLAKQGNAHSLWGDGDEGYCVLGTDLVHLTVDSTGAITSSVVRANMPPALRVSFCRTPIRDVIWANGLSIGRLTAGEDAPVATPRPNVVPAISRIDGALPAGRYQVAFTATGVHGESGASAAAQIDLPANSGIHVEPVGQFQVYMTSANGSVFNRVSGDGSGNYTTLAYDGQQLQTMLLEAMPAGHIVRYYRASILVATGKHLLISDPFNYGMLSADRGFISFGSRITLVMPCEGGVYVCTEHMTYWLPGALDSTTPARVLEYGGLEHSDGVMPTNDGEGQQRKVFWLSNRGLMVGTAEGSVSAVQERALKFGRARTGATFYREQDGANHVIAARKDATPAVTLSDTFNPLDTTAKGTTV